MVKRTQKSISLALQGGGAHGAFTWGVLDRLCDEPGLDIKAISATSAGAMNAAAFAAGFAKGGRAGAKTSLSDFWRAVSRKGAPYSGLTMTENAFEHFPFSPFQTAMAMTAFASPYEFNPFDVNPLRDLLDETIDFDAIHHSPLELFISATNVETGRVKVFNDGEVSRDAVLASACLPQTFRAIEIDGSAYWDGGYMGNPSLFPLVYSGSPADVLMVLLNPISRLGVPKKVAAINDRLNEISFNASLIGELRAIA
ncbi:MAG: patatin-like phospholipase family protein, partial [Pseudomonadota bacterium]